MANIKILKILILLYSVLSYHNILIYNMKRSVLLN